MAVTEPNASETVNSGELGHVAHTRRLAKLANQAKAEINGRLSDENLSATIATGASFVAAAKGDFTGRPGVAGSGTDDRAEIQAALNAAGDSAASSASYYGYLSAITKVVRLDPSRHYLVEAPSGGGPSLIVPPRVFFDTRGARITFEYPASATRNWCAILVGQYSQLGVGRLMIRSGSTPPDSALIYDAVRVVGTDNQTRVVGLEGDSEISGFRAGAGVRYIGAYITHLMGVRITGGAYGVVAGAFGDAFNYTYPDGSPIPASRRTTDVSFDKMNIVNMTHGGVILGAQHAAADPNATGYTYQMGSTQRFGEVVIEQVNGPAVRAVGCFMLDLGGLSVENCGVAGGGVIVLDTVRSFTWMGMRWNNGGGPVPVAGGGTTTVSPARLFQQSSVGSFTVFGYTFNDQNSAIDFINTGTAPSTYQWLINAEGFDFPTSIYYRGELLHTFGPAEWNRGNVVFGRGHIWRDANGVIRGKNGAPTADTDGRAVVPVNAQTVKTAAHTIVAVDEGSVIEVDAGSGVTITVPTDAAVPMPIGTVIDVFQRQAAGQVTVAGDTGVTVVSPTGFAKTRAQYSTIRLRKRAANFWVLAGDLATS